MENEAVAGPSRTDDRHDPAFQDRLREAPCGGPEEQRSPILPPPIKRRKCNHGGAEERGAVRLAEPPTPFLLPENDENSLYNILRFNRTAINVVVDTWIEEYNSNSERALAQLMQFFINSSGCRGKVTPDMLHMHNTLFIQKVTQECDKESGEYPLSRIRYGRIWNNFHSNFCEFIQTLVKSCRFSLPYDRYLKLMDNIISLLIRLSSSTARAIRHTAILAAIKLMAALADVVLEVSVISDHCQRSYEDQARRTRDERASERLELLVAKRQELELNMSKTKERITFVFNAVFVHRFRDIVPHIRAITMSEIGNLLMKHPLHFLDDSKLEYIGWNLNDKVGEVRLRCLQALQPLFECEQLKGKLEQFTSSFKDRIVSMTLDTEPDVAVHAVRLVTTILKMHPGVLTENDCELVYQVVYSSLREVALAAGEFVDEHLSRCHDAATPALRSRCGRNRLPNTPFIRKILQFFVKPKPHKRAAYLVDSLIGRTPWIKDWECMTDLLLQEAGPSEEPLENRQKSSLIELMLCSVQQATTGKPPEGRGASRGDQVLSNEQMVRDDRAKMTTHFIMYLPELLKKFGSDPKALANLVTIPQYYDLELYTSQRQEWYLNLLLAKIVEIFDSQNNEEVLETSSRTLEYLCSQQHAVYMRCNMMRTGITTACVKSYRDAIDDYRRLIERGETPSSFDVTISLHKVCSMYMYHNLNDTNIWDSLFEELTKRNETQMSKQVLRCVLRACFYSVQWSQRELEERGGGSDHEAAALLERVQAFLAHCRDIVADRAQEPSEEAYKIICDMLIYFTKEPAGAGGAHRELEEAHRDALCNVISDFVQEVVFAPDYGVQDERRTEQLHKRRNFLAAYCKLIVHNVMPMHRAADVIKHYIKDYNVYGEIFYETLSKVCEINRKNCAVIMHHAMRVGFLELLRKYHKPSRTLPEFQELKELAKRFSVVFGLDAEQNREAMRTIHCTGIAFAAEDGGTGAAGTARRPPPNLLYLELLAEFSGKLLQEDKRIVLKHIEWHFTAAVQWGEEWAPLLAYRLTMLNDAPDERPRPRRRSHM